MPGLGFVLGKFMPPHRGHVALVDYARRCCDDLVVLVCSQPGEPIPGELRVSWMRELFPSVDVRWLHRSLPQRPEDDPAFWGVWREASLEALDGRTPAFVVASEPYGATLASVLGARFLPFDRTLLEVSGTAVRADPLGRWEDLPPPVRAWYARRVAVVGPESTGKTTLARALAARFRTSWVPEIARLYLDPRGGRCEPGDIDLFVTAQVAAEDALARQCDRVLFCDTEGLTTALWARVLLGRERPDIVEAASRRRYDLTLLLAPDVPWVADPQRNHAASRQAFHDELGALLEGLGRRVVRVAGGWEARWDTAVSAVEALMAEPGGPG